MNAIPELRLYVGIGVVLAVATYAKYILGWSTKDFIVSLIREFRDLMGGNFTPGGLNAGTIVVALIVLGAYLFFPKFEKIISSAGASESYSPSEAAVLGSAAMIIVGGLVCVSLVRPR